MFQFAAIINVGALTLGFDKGLLKPSDDLIAGIFLVAVNLLVAIISLRTEFSNRVYNVSYFKTLNEIERKINGENYNGQEKPLLGNGGPFMQGGPAMATLWVRRIPNPDRLHMAFYVLLIVFLVALGCRLLYS